MPIYYYKVQLPDGKIKTSSLVADDRQSAIRQLKETERFIICLYEKNTTPFSGILRRKTFSNSATKNKFFAAAETKSDRASVNINVRRRKIAKNDMAAYCRQLAILLGSGIAILEALHLLAEQVSNRQLQKISYQIAADLQRGLSLQESFTAFREQLDDFFLQMVAVGEMGGCMEQVLEHLAAYYEQENELFRKIKAALFYPCTILTLALALLVAALTLILPTFDNLLAMYGSDLPEITQFVMGISAFLRQHWWKILLVITLSVAAMVLLNRKSRAWAQATDAVVLKLPLVGNFIKLILISRLCRTLSILLTSGVALIEALKAGKMVCNNLVVQNILEQAVLNIKEGKGLAEPLRGNKVFPPLMVQMVLLGEETGRLEVMLGQAGCYYEKEIAVAMEKSSVVLEPILLLTAGLLVGFIIISIMLPLFSAVTVIS